MKLIDLCKKFNVTEEIPNTLKEVELEEDILNFTDYTVKDKVYVFTGEYSPVWFEGDTELEVSVEIDLTPFSDEVLSNVNDSDRLSELMVDLDDEEKQNIILYEALTFVKTIENNFYAISVYNLLGGLTLIS